MEFVAGLCGQSLCAYSCKSRSVPGWALAPSGVVVSGLICGYLLTATPPAVYLALSAGAALALARVGRWDNARAEYAPRWEAHGCGATTLVSEAWALALVWCSGATFARLLLALFDWQPLFAVLVTVCALVLGSAQVSYPGGPRSRPIDRQPEFKTGSRPSPMAGWKYVGAGESHARSNAQVEGVALTGEPAGRQTWFFDEAAPVEAASFDPSVNPNSADLLYRRQRIAAYENIEQKDEDALRKGFRFYRMLQADDGHWAGDYGGPHFLSPGLVIVWYATGKKDVVLDAHQREAMILYYKNHQQRDGGWGTHIESPSTMFGSTLTYVALRLLGLSPETDQCMADALEFLKAHGGALYTSSWAKFGLCILGAMHWDGHESVPPEMWLLPEWCPFHPCRMWCHARMVYLPMSYLWGKRFVYENAETDPVVLALRRELYCAQDYASIDWTSTRSLVAPMDAYSPVHPLMRLAQLILRCYEASWLLGPLRRAVRSRGVDFAATYVRAEDLQTNYVDIGPVNKVWNMLIAFDDPQRDHKDFLMHALRVRDYLWVAEDGLKMQGYNGSQAWDTSFATQALAESKLGDEPAFRDCAAKAFGFLERTQILSTPVSAASPAMAYESDCAREKFFRHVSKGGWPFSTSAHGWPISDCTAEGLKSVLAMQQTLKCIDHPIPFDRLADAANVLLTLQNADGGWATYENNRGYGWFEWLNPSEVFGDIMIDYSYVECSMASAGALRRFHEAFPHHRAREITTALDRGNAFLKSIQRPDGSWYGSWGVCFTYACWFGIEGLVDTGEKVTSKYVKRACAFLLSQQRDDGGWGETFESCFDKAYSNAPESNVVNSAWALLGLMAGECDDRAAVERGIAFIKRLQQPNGDWPQQGMSGVFNRSCGITYTAYRNVFPLWALARYTNTYTN